MFLIHPTLPLPAAIDPTTAAVLVPIALGVIYLLLAQRRATARASAAVRAAAARTEELERELAKLQDAEQDWPRREERSRSTT